MSKGCKYCGSLTHYSIACFQKPRKPLKNKKAIHKFGKTAAKWMEVRNEWIQQNPSTDGYWYCYLKISPMCIIRMDIDQLSLDHIIPKGSNPDLRYDLSNLGAACIFCNNLKGSRSLEAVKNKTSGNI